MAWYYDPHVGGRKIPAAVQEQTRKRIVAYAARKYSGKYDRLEVRFRGALCYVDACCDSSPQPVHLVRLRYLGDQEKWSVAFYTYSHEKYEPCMLPDGTFVGTPEDAFDVGAVYLQ